MTKKERYQGIIKWFEENNPEPVSELHYDNPFQLLVAVILSAQCTDKLVNKVTPALFEAFPTPEVMAASNKEAIYEFIKSVSYPNQKAKHLAGMAKMLVNDYNGEIPGSIAEMENLPGVGHKTANVVGSIVFDIPAIAVDTHVFRVSNRIGLTINSKTPVETEKELTKHIPRELWSKAHHWLILHGRYTCQARKPKCDQCGIKDYCKYYSKTL
ncbi:endonuclease III [Bacteroidales bacterium OttesenSCG-928-I14]|nr:endonuclease III [Bacteroidales bacterium OttesenSCG-928-I14]